MLCGYRNADGSCCMGNFGNILAKYSMSLLGRRRARYWKVISKLISIPPKYSVAQVVGYMKGKSAIHIARIYLGQRKNYSGMHFWARGYFVSTVGADEEVVRVYINNQEKEDQRIEQLSLFKEG